MPDRKPPAVPVDPADAAPGVPNPATGEAGPPGTVYWYSGRPYDAVGQDMVTYHATRTDRPPERPAPAPHADPKPPAAK